MPRMAPVTSMFRFPSWFIERRCREVLDLICLIASKRHLREQQLATTQFRYL